MQPGRWENGSGMASRFLVSQISLQSWERRGQLSKDEKAPVRDSWKQQAAAGSRKTVFSLKAELGVSCMHVL